MIYGYARVSTKMQKLDSQIRDLKEAGAEKIFAEKFTGTTTKRPEFERLLKTVKEGDTVIVTKLDRMARNTQEALQTVQGFFDQGVKINILNMGLIDNTPTGKLILTIFSGFAQFERDLIVSRTKEGREYAREHDPHYREGRPPKFTPEQLKWGYSLWKQGKTRKMVAKATGISIATQKRLFKQFEDD